ncbi:hypothetical protein [Streptomyces sp. NPDC001787]|uniref:hypothetical protein n=1 Tax=Streptomyces sp. NPDC001787 TaxID=3154523 RepID=UPI00333099E4
MFTPETRHALVHRAAHPTVEKKLQTGFDQDYSPQLNAESGLPGWTGAHRYHVRFPDHARRHRRTRVQPGQVMVDVWASGLFSLTGDGRPAPATNWLTLTVRLRWTTTGWRMNGLSQTEGPTPGKEILGQTPPL